MDAYLQASGGGNRIVLFQEREHELAEALEAYTDPNHPEYDEEFDKKIRALRPDWFDDVN